MKKAKAMYIPAGEKKAVWGPVDHNVLPEGYPYKAMGEVALLTEQSVAFSVMGNGYGAQLNYDDFSHLTIGNKLKVLFDEEEYICAVCSAYGVLFAGNASAVGLGDDTGEPFFIMFNPDEQTASIGTNLTDATHIIGISEFAETIQPMAEEFMPLLTSPNGTKYKLTVADDGTLSAVAVT